MFDWTNVYDPERIGIANIAAIEPERPAFIGGNTVITYGKLNQKINAVANALLKLGLKPGDHIGALFPNSYEVYLIWAAAAKLQVTALAVNFKLKESELTYIIEDSSCKLLVYHHKFESLVDRLKDTLTRTSPILICAGADSTLAKEDRYNLEALITRSSTTPPQVEESPAMVPPTLTYTSGTTGKPKGVLRSGKKRFNYLLWQANLCGAGYDDVHLVAGPLYHTAPFGWGAFSLLLGNKIIIMPKFDAEELLKLVDQHRVTTIFMVPTMIHRILNLPDHVRQNYDISSLKSITVAGEPFPFSIKKRSIEFFGQGKLYEFYGGTEIGVTTHLKPEDQLKKPGSCGKTLDDIDVLILDENKKRVPEGEVGIFYIKSPFLLDGYHGNPEATAANFLNDYFTVGDMGYVDSEGFYYLVDRAVDMIISGGVNIYPAEIEEVLYGHQDIQAAAVIGVPDPAWGEKIVAYVVINQDAALDQTDIIEYIGANMATYKKPKEVIFVDELPTSSTGKVLKRQLRKTHNQGVQ